MAYYPKSQVKTNLFTNGDEYILSTNKDRYKGYYYLTATGKAYSGKSPGNGYNVKLLPINDVYNDFPETLNFDKLSDQDNQIFLANDVIQTEIISEDGFTTTPYIYPYDIDFTGNVTQGNRSIPIGYPKINEFSTRVIPTYSPTIPTQNDKNLGVFNRYFCKKNNELKYLEINLSTYKKLQSKDPQIAWELYSPTTTLWYLKGDKEQIYKTNYGVVSLVEKNQQWYGFSQYFQGKFLQYYVES